MNASNDTDQDSSPPDGGDRRDFNTKAAAGILGTLLGAIPAALGSIFFLDPLLRNNSDEDGGSDDFVRLPVSPDNIPEDGTPQLVVVRADRDDAWNHFPNQAIGSVWLRRDNGGQIVAFTTICPHLGCSVDYRDASNDFFCPCHTSTFDLDGKQLNSIPPRGMDTLEVEDRDGQLWIRYQNFLGATADKVVV